MSRAALALVVALAAAPVVAPVLSPRLVGAQEAFLPFREFTSFNTEPRLNLSPFTVPPQQPYTGYVEVTPPSVRLPAYAEPPWGGYPALTPPPPTPAPPYREGPYRNYRPVGPIVQGSYNEVRQNPFAPFLPFSPLPGK